MKTSKIFKVLRFFFVAALILTVIFTIIMLVESATPGDESSKHSGAMSDVIKDAFDVNDGSMSYETERLSVSIACGYANRDVAARVTFYPESATDRDVIWSVEERGDVNAVSASSSCRVADIDEKGIVHFKQSGELAVTVTLKSDPTISATAYATCYGTHPDDITSLTPVQTAFKQGYYARFILLDQDGNRVMTDGLTLDSDNPSVVRFTPSYIIAEDAGSANVVVKAGKSGRELASFTCTVQKNDAYIRPQQLALENSDVTLNVGDELSLVKDDFFKVLPAGSAKYFGYNIKISGATVLKKLTATKVEALAKGDATVTITSFADPDLSLTVNVHVVVPKPSSLKIIGSNRITVDDAKYYYAFGDGNYIDDVTWSVLKGKVKNYGDGTFRAERLGKIVLRATYVDDPSLYADIEITVSLFANFGMFVRKIIGHFLLFAALGLGWSTIFMLGLKKKWLGLVLALVLSLGLAITSECLQLPAVTTGRYASWTDVGIDFVGSLLGICVTLLAFLIYRLLQRFSSSPADYNAAMKSLSFKTAFKQAKNIPTLNETAYISQKTPSNEDDHHPVEAADGAAQTADIPAQTIGDDSANANVTDIAQADNAVPSNESNADITQTADDIAQTAPLVAADNAEH